MTTTSAVNAVMQKREAPEFTRFAEGEQITGRLIAIDGMQMKGKVVSKYTVELGSAKLEGGRITEFVKHGKRVSFLGTVKLNEFMQMEDLGHYVEITCTGTDKNVSRGDNFMQLFDVLVSSGVMHWGKVGANAAPDGTEITDDDIGF